MIRAPYDNLIVTISQKFYDSVKFESGVTLFYDPKWDPSEHSMLEAKVVSVPRTIQVREDFEGFSTEGIKPGDDILMRYDVVFAYKAQPDNDTTRFKNEMWYRQKSYWRADIRKVFAVVKDGAYHMLHDYILCEPIIEKQSVMFSDKIIRPNSYLEITRLDEVIVKSIGKNNMGILPGDRIEVLPKIMQQYKINGKLYFLISHRHVLGKCL